MKKIISLLAVFSAAALSGVCCADSGKTAYMVISDSVNFSGNYITEDIRKQIQFSTDFDLSDMTGKNVKAYIRVNDDGSFGLVRLETE